MALPKLVSPEFTIIVPSTKEPLKIRPFLVKEEKVLYIALEGGSDNDIQDAMIQVLENCIITPGVNVRNLASYDIEYLFLKLRTKSVGEMIPLRMKHGDDNPCKHITEVEINADDIEVKFNEKHTDKIDLGGGIGIKFREPSLKQVIGITQTNKTNNDFDMLMSVVGDSIEMIYDTENVYDDFTKDELLDFLQSMTQEQFNKVQEFFNTLPKLTTDVSWTCSECGGSESVTVEGLQSFFD